MGVTTENTRYDALDGIRTFSAIGIVIMHVLANGKYALTGFVFESLIPSFTNLVFLFMMISAFGMCCGYYEKIQKNEISLDKFYQKRFVKILPFFGLLCLLDVAMSFSKEALIELFANLTLCFGFLPNAGNISVIGVGWFLGVLFVFYIAFPFFCCLLKTKRRAWFVLLVSYLFCVICADYFGIARTNILRDAVYFVSGGLLYLYRDKLAYLSERFRIVAGLLILLFAVLYYVIGSYELVMLGLYGSILIFAMGVRRKGILWNRCTKFLSSISMEIYLCHMVCFRVIERFGLTKCFKNDVASFAVAVVLTLAGSAIFAVAAQWGFAQIGKIFSKVCAVRRKE